MGKSLILAINQLAQGQNQAYITHNDAVNALEESTNAVKTITDTGNYVLTEVEITRFAVFRFTSHTANITLSTPATINGASNPTKRVFYIDNPSSAYTIAVTPVGGNTIVVPTETIMNFVQEGTSLIAIGSGGTNLGLNHTAALFVAGSPTGGAEVLRYAFTENVTWVDDFAGSDGSVGTNPSKPIVFQVYKNGSNIGSVTCSTGGAFTFVSTGGGVTEWVSGDALSVSFEDLEEATVTFNSIPDNMDAVGISDGGGNSVAFSIGTLTGQVNPGGSTSAAATNLDTAIDASSLNTNLTATPSGAVVTVVNDVTSNTADIAQLEVGKVVFNTVADVGDTITIDDGGGGTTFTYVASGASGLQVNVGATATDSCSNLESVVNAQSMNLDLYRDVADLYLVNTDFAGGGAITKSDANNSYTITDFAIDVDNDINYTEFASDSSGANFAVSFIGVRA